MTENGINLQFRIVNISVENFSLCPENIIPGQKLPINYTFEMGIAVAVEKEKNSISIKISADVFADEKKKYKLSNLTTITNFEIPNMNDLPHDKKKISIPDDLVRTLAGIAISTTRGVWHNKLIGSPINNVILPLINPNDIKKPLKNYPTSGKSTRSSTKRKKKS